MSTPCIFYRRNPMRHGVPGLAPADPRHQVLLSQALGAGRYSTGVSLLHTSREGALLGNKN